MRVAICNFDLHVRQQLPYSVENIKNSDHEMSKKTVLITGASSGLGEALAKYCAAQGHHLALVARRVERLEQIAEEIREQFHVQVEVAQLDVNEHDKILPIFMGLSDLLSGIDIVVINAGIVHVRRLADDRIDKDIAIFNTNVLSAIACSDAAQHMFRFQGKGGQIAVISSYSAFLACHKLRLTRPVRPQLPAILMPFAQLCRNVILLSQSFIQGLSKQIYYVVLVPICRLLPTLMMWQNLFLMPLCNRRPRQLCHHCHGR